jgi:hypothetical protein
MLEDLNSIDTNGTCPGRDIKLRPGSTESLRDRIKKWRECRENKFGKVYSLYDVYILGG